MKIGNFWKIYEKIKFLRIYEKYVKKQKDFDKAIKISMKCEKMIKSQKL